jgi:hypothetical protein
MTILYLTLYRLSRARIVRLRSENAENAYISTSIRWISIFFFQYSLVSILLTTEVSSFWAAVATEFSRKKGKKSVLFAPSTVENHFSVPQFWLHQNNFS